ncbi:MAG: alpha-amylase family glycosyl hydrolase, partial [Microbacteriaceae bacterium]
SRYVFRDGHGPSGESPPNNWRSVFGGPAWTRVAGPRQRPQWYLHLFDPAQPDLNWRNPEVVAEFEDILRFWLDRGIDGFRIDVAHGLIKQDGLPDWDEASAAISGGNGAPMWDQDEVHEIYRGWNAVLAEYGGDRILVAEAWVSPAERLGRYVRVDEMQQAFNFEFMKAGWDPMRMQHSIDTALSTNAAVGATTTWVLSNHDVVRHTSRFGLVDPTRWTNGIGPDDEQPDAALGLTRGRAATLLLLALPGSAYLYQGAELGLPEHTQLPAGARQDPTFFRTGGAEVGRDGCRVPIPWRSQAPGYGFGPTDKTWLPQPEAFAALAVDRQDGIPGSTLELYRTAISERRRLGLGRGQLRWNEASRTVLDLTNTGKAEPGAAERDARGDGIRVLVNFGTTPLPLPAGHEVLLASEEAAIAGGALAPNTAAWLRHRASPNA